MRTALNKATLTQQTKQMKLYRQFLPALDLKRKQLLAGRALSARALQSLQEQIETLNRQVGASLPMLANEEVALEDLVRLTRVERGEENLAGVTLPVLREVVVTVREYSPFALPHWVDTLVQRMTDSLRLRVALQIEQQRLALLDAAVQVMTQRVNLFEHVLIPRSEETIRRIGIFLSDAERAAVVRAKIAKRKRKAAEGAA